MGDVKLLPLPKPFVSDLIHGDLYTEEQVRACVEANAEALRRDNERLAEALQHVKQKLEDVARIRGGHGTFASTYRAVTEGLNPATAQEGDHG